jgi:hypothetical protein
MGFPLTGFQRGRLVAHAFMRCPIYLSMPADSFQMAPCHPVVDKAAPNLESAYGIAMRLLRPAHRRSDCKVRLTVLSRANSGSLKRFAGYFLDVESTGFLPRVCVAL